MEQIFYSVAPIGLIVICDSGWQSEGVSLGEDKMV